jgi:hypothetical protein
VSVAPRCAAPDTPFRGRTGTLRPTESACSASTSFRCGGGRRRIPAGRTRRFHIAGVAGADDWSFTGVREPALVDEPHASGLARSVAPASLQSKSPLRGRLRRVLTDLPLTSAPSGACWPRGPASPFSVQPPPGRLTAADTHSTHWVQMSRDVPRRPPPRARLWSAECLLGGPESTHDSLRPACPHPTGPESAVRELRLAQPTSSEPICCTRLLYKTRFRPSYLGGPASNASICGEFL